MSLAEMARAQLRAAKLEDTLEHRFWRAALETLALGEVVDPAVADLVAVLPRGGLFDDLPPHADQRGDRIRALQDFTLLAIVEGAEVILELLDARWAEDPDPAVDWPRAWIALFQRGESVDADALELLVEDDLVQPETPLDAAWLALMAQQPEIARGYLEQLKLACTSRLRAWQDQPQLALQVAWHQPRIVLMLHERALESILTRWVGAHGV